MGTVGMVGHFYSLVFLSSSVIYLYEQSPVLAVELRMTFNDPRSGGHMLHRILVIPRLMYLNGRLD